MTAPERSTGEATGPVDGSLQAFLRRRVVAADSTLEEAGFELTVPLPSQHPRRAVKAVIKSYALALLQPRRGG
jgi:hypothetical protein